MRKEKKGKAEVQGRKNVWFYGLGAFGLALLVTAALLAPKLVLELQDSVRCGEVVLGELESMDITSFNTGYETDLYTRLFRFAEGLEEGRQYYVAEQDITATLEVEEFLDSEKGLYQDAFLIWVDEGALPEEMLSYNLSQCKQYVIYGDNFSDGVNFILWYLELRNDAGMPLLKLLLDAETGEIYGISSTQSEDNLLPGEKLEDAMLTLEALFGMTDADMQDMWYALAYYYGGQVNSEMLRMLEEYGYLYFYLTEGTKNEMSSVGGYVTEPYENAEIKAALEKVKWETGREGNRLDFLFPYGRDGNLEEASELCFRVEANYVMVIKNKEGNIFRPKNFTLGFPEIYERIPGFAEN